MVASLVGELVDVRVAATVGAMADPMADGSAALLVAL